MFTSSTWDHTAADLLGVTLEQCGRLPGELAAMLLPGSRAIWGTSPRSHPEITLWCGWHKHTLKIGAILPRRLVWPQLTFLNGSPKIAYMGLSDTLLGAWVNGSLIELACPAFMFCHDDVIRIMGSWHAGRGGVNADHMDETTSMHMFKRDVVIIVRSLERKAGLFVRDAPIESVVAQARLEVSRMLNLAQLVLDRPLDIPCSTVPIFMDWLRQRFFIPQRYPTDHAIVSQAYAGHAFTILQGLWHTKRARKLVPSADRDQLIQGDPDHAIKHMLLDTLSQPEWADVRRRLLSEALTVKRNLLSHDNSRRRQSLDSHLAFQALYLVFKFREEPELQGWFSKEHASLGTIIESTFGDIDAGLRPYYMMYALGDELERRQFSTLIDVNETGMLEVRDWVVTQRDGSHALRLNHAQFAPALVDVCKRHAWRERNVPGWVYQIVEVRFAQGDLRVADMLAWHPERVRVLAEVCGQSARRARWLISWLAYHPHVVEPAFMPALFLMSPEQIGGLNNAEIFSLYEHLERAPAPLRKAHLEQTRTIVACAVARLGSNVFDKLDEVLKDSVNADLMAHIHATIEELPRLSFKRRALKREQEQVLEHVEGSEHFGMLSLHREDPMLQGALSASGDEPAP